MFSGAVRPVRSSLLKKQQGETNIDINDIIEAIRTNRVRISDHADEEAAADQLSFDEIFLSVLQGEIIEDYPTDTPYPSCLIYGRPSAVSLFIACGHITLKINGRS